MNPLRARLGLNSKALKKYPWCGHGTLLGVWSDGIIDRDYVLAHFGRSEREAVRKYEEYLADRFKEYKRGEYSGGGLVRSMGGMGNVLSLKGSGEKEMFDARVLGGGNFVERVLKAAGEPGGARRKSREEVLKEVVRESGILAKDILRRGHGRAAARARAMYCYLSKEEAGASGAELKRELRVTQSGVSKLVERGRVLFEKNS